DQVAIGRMDLHAVEARCKRTLRGTGEPFNRRVDLRLVHRRRRAVTPLPAIERQLLALRLDRRRSGRAITEPVALREGTGMHQLGEDLRAMGVDAFDDPGPGPLLQVIGEARLEQVSLRVLAI